ncbi:hypothetical protein [Asanoa iriomotensis]|uniref:Uncharacterized protein n=1 Tax=Asanoa iriomotensis TaxID=234613 RepID=A0ABQ4BX32_9ACTN|nr:hypothetical protein [Asanoa iriomotensis]GIF55088.1 hypothetical protein Air01nite_11830 [Asanoa iriomotensis]
MSDLAGARRQALTRVFTLLGASFVLSCVSAYLLVGPSVAAGWVVGLLALALAVVGVVGFHRFPGPSPSHRSRYGPGELGSTRALAWSLALLAQLPWVIALTVLMDRP